MPVSKGGAYSSQMLIKAGMRGSYDYKGRDGGIGCALGRMRGLFNGEGKEKEICKGRMRCRRGVGQSLQFVGK